MRKEGGSRGARAARRRGRRRSSGTTARGLRVRASAREHAGPLHRSVAASRRRLRQGRRLRPREVGRVPVHVALRHFDARADLAEPGLQRDPLAPQPLEQGQRPREGGFRGRRGAPDAHVRKRSGRMAA